MSIICKTFAVLLIAFGLLGLSSSASWASVRDDRVSDFMLGAVLFLLGILLYRVS